MKSLKLHIVPISDYVSLVDDADLFPLINSEDMLRPLQYPAATLVIILGMQVLQAAYAVVTAVVVLLTEHMLTDLGILQHFSYFLIKI